MMTIAAFSAEYSLYTLKQKLQSNLRINIIQHTYTFPENIPSKESITLSVLAYSQYLMSSLYAVLSVEI